MPVRALATWTLGEGKGFRLTAGKKKPQAGTIACASPKRTARFMAKNGTLPFQTPARSASPGKPPKLGEQVEADGRLPEKRGQTWVAFLRGVPWQEVTKSPAKGHGGMEGLLQCGKASHRVDRKRFAWRRPVEESSGRANFC